MFILKKKAIDFLNQYLKLPVRGGEQDWDVELADPSRLEEFLDCYRDDFSNDIKLAMMALIFASYDDYIGKYKSNINIEVKLRKLIAADKDLFFDLLRYWAVEKRENLKDCFKLAAFARGTLSELYS